MVHRLPAVPVVQTPVILTIQCKTYETGRKWLNYKQRNEIELLLKVHIMVGLDSIRNVRWPEISYANTAEGY